ncbi:TolC family protein [Sphingomonas sp. R86520]|uniref:TolC family protein n=1 Tax=Sphingomonas sp. R86520 TaxID=3093859 RepID=UPI0036D42247
MFKGSSEAFNYGGTLNLPIFDWGRRTAQVRLNSAQADELDTAYQRTVQGAFQEVADALIARQHYAEQIAA